MTLEEDIEEAFDMAEKHTRQKVEDSFNMTMEYLDVFYDAFKSAITPILEKRMGERHEYEIVKEDEDQAIYKKGFAQGVKVSKICARCKDKAALTIHHIIPRSIGGEDYPENLIALCFKCHNDVEGLTDSLDIGAHHYTLEELESFIIHAFPNEDASEKRLDA